MRYIDNASTDESVAVVRSSMPGADIISLTENTGYGGGHNIGFSRCTTPYILLLNPDTECNWSGILKLAQGLEEHPTWGAAQGLLLRPGTPERIDSAGIMRTITLNGVDRGAGQLRTSFSESETAVDACTGAASLFRLTALQEVAYGEYEIAGHTALEVFDKEFFAYKEDVDLGWRLQRADWINMFIPTVVATHVRQIQPTKVSSLAAIKSKLFDRRTALSLRNYIWMITKNATAKELLLHGVFIDARLIFMFLISLIYWPLIPVWGQTLRGLPDMLHKRSYEAINHNR